MVCLKGLKKRIHRPVDALSYLGVCGKPSRGSSQMFLVWPIGCPMGQTQNSRVLWEPYLGLGAINLCGL